MLAKTKNLSCFAVYPVNVSIAAVVIVRRLAHTITCVDAVAAKFQQSKDAFSVSRKVFGLVHMLSKI